MFRESVSRDTTGRGGAASRHEDTLLKYPFLKQLQREKRRADRSKAPLSIVVFRHFNGGGDEVANTRKLLTLLQQNKRETDVLGHLGSSVVAILLTDTGKEGVEGFMRKIACHIDARAFSSVAETYPDHLFEDILAGEAAAADYTQVATEDTTAPSALGMFVKRIIDVVFALIAIVVLSPVMLALAIAIAIDSPGPVIFRQSRLGKNGAPFTFYKFRSMVVNGNDGIHREFVTSLIRGDLEDVRKQNDAGSDASPMFKLKADPRITSIGRFMRQTSLDELPQLFNVLKGNMSLVGPRPPLPYEAENYQSWHLRRVLEIKPGITGLWQVEGRSRVTFDEMVRMDLRYIRNWSLLLDFKILAKTILVVLRREGGK